MESLLAVAFDNTSSKDSQKIRKGLRQIEGLLAQICLSKSSSVSPAKSRFSVIPTELNSGPKQLEQLADDLAFREFFRLQEGFEWNGEHVHYGHLADEDDTDTSSTIVASRLVSCLERLLGQTSSGANDLLIVNALDIIQGLLLLHPPSRSLYSQETYMNSLLDLLDPSNCPAIQSSALLVLVSALIDQPRNIRTLERIDGLLTITSLFKSRSTTQEVKMKVIEFLYFYLMPEAAPASATSAPATAILQRTPSKLSNASTGGLPGRPRGPEQTMRSTQEKQRLLGKYLSNVEELVQDLEENAPFHVGAVMV